MKVPWLSRAIKYRSINCLWFEAVAEIEFVLVRHIQSDLSVESLRDKNANLENFVQKLRTCPFIILNDQEYVTVDEVKPWIDSDFTVLESEIAFDESCVHVNFFSSIDNYSESVNVVPMFCRTMCLPKFITKDDIKQLQTNRLSLLEKQISDWRVIQSNSTCATVYNGTQMRTRTSLQI